MSHIRPVTGAGTPVINILSTLRTAPDLCKNNPLTLLFGSNGNSHTISTQSDMYRYTHILHNVEKLVAQNKQK
jgi:hypothetical protein